MKAQKRMWTEEYRPTTLDEVYGHEAAVERFERFLTDDAGMPHVLLAGPPGVGKTAVIASFAQEKYGDDIQANFREFNASDERGIDVVREQIKEYCRRAPTGGHDYKIVFLDEADQLTRDAQPALRRVMEQFSDSTSFALSCNYANEIIDPLQSRCATFHFGRIEDEQVRALVEDIISQEGIEAEDGAVRKVVKSARGQARDAIMTLQLSAMDGELREDQVQLFTGVVDDGLTEEIFTLALEGKLDEAMARLDVEILKEGADPNHLVDSVFRVIRKLDLPPDHRVKCLELLADIDERLHMGLNPHVQFHALLGHVYVSQGVSPIAQQSEGE